MYCNLLFPLFFPLSIASSDVQIIPYTLPMDTTMWSDLQKRLALTRFPDELNNMTNDWSYGVPLQYMRDIVEYWQHEFDWELQVNALNKMPQFTAQIAEYNVHFVHKISPDPNAIPLIIVHGWPGSFFECSKILPFLTSQDKDGSFNVVCPSIPGYGMSTRPNETGFDVVEVAKILHHLMQALGYNRYLAQGGDWGSYIATFMADMYPNSVIGLHLNMIPVNYPLKKGIFATAHTILAFLFPNQFLSAEEVADKPDLTELLEMTGYFHQQSTRPQTLGYGLNDSPTGLAAWIIEKFYAWSDCNGDIEKRFTKDELLTNVMLYWSTGTITSSMRLYYEFWHSKNDIYSRLAKLDVTTPTAAAVFPKELSKPARVFVSYFYNIVRWTRFESGGHFAALEEPEKLANDIREFSKQLIPQNVSKESCNTG